MVDNINKKILLLLLSVFFPSLSYSTSTLTEEQQAASKNHIYCPNAILEDLRMVPKSEKIAAEPQFQSVVQFIMQCNPSPDDKKGRVSYYSQTALVVHAKGILTCARGFIMEDLLTDIQEYDAITLKARLKNKIYISESPVSELKNALRAEACWVYLPKIYYDKVRIEGINRESSILEDLLPYYKNNYAFVHIGIQEDLKVFNFDIFKELPEYGEQIFKTCGFFKDLATMTIKKQFAQILYSCFPLYGEDEYIECYLNFVPAFADAHEFPTFFRIQDGFYGSPMLLIKNGHAYLVGLFSHHIWRLTGEFEVESIGKKIIDSECNIITPLLEEKLGSITTPDLSKQVQQVYDRFHDDLDARYGPQPRILNYGK